MIYNPAMPDETWTYTPVGQAKKALAKGLQGRAGNALDLFLVELSDLAPYRSNWPNYTKMSSEDYHCHLKKGRPTYVVCWRIISKIEKTIEVYYAGTHEKAPY